MSILLEDLHLSTCSSDCSWDSGSLYLQTPEQMPLSYNRCFWHPSVLRDHGVAFRSEVKLLH